MATTYQAAHRRAAAAAVTALGNRIGLYVGATRVGTVFADTTWSAPVDDTYSGNAVAKSTGSTVTITVPASTVASGTVINKYGIHNGTTLLRTQDLPVSLVVNDGSQSFDVDLTPVFMYRGE